MWLDVTGKGLQRQTIVSKEKVWIQFQLKDHLYSNGWVVSLFLLHLQIITVANVPNNERIGNKSFRPIQCGIQYIPQYPFQWKRYLYAYKFLYIEIPIFQIIKEQYENNTLLITYQQITIPGKFGSNFYIKYLLTSWLFKYSIRFN